MVTGCRCASVLFRLGTLEKKRKKSFNPIGLFIQKHIGNGDLKKREKDLTLFGTQWVEFSRFAQ